VKVREHSMVSCCMYLRSPQPSSNIYHFPSLWFTRTPLSCVPGLRNVLQSSLCVTPSWREQRVARLAESPASRPVESLARQNLNPWKRITLVPARLARLRP
jgi:hypothetical protein